MGGSERGEEGRRAGEVELLRLRRGRREDSGRMAEHKRRKTKGKTERDRDKKSLLETMLHTTS